MTRDTAERVVRALLSAVREVNDNLFLVRSEVSETMYEEYRKSSAQVMAAIYLDLVKPIVNEYPDLDPGLNEPNEK